MGKLSFLAGAAAGYVLGARAGTQRYEQIKSGAGQLWQSKPVQDQVETAKHAAKTKAAPAALDAVSSAASVAGDKMRQGAGKIKGDSSRDVSGQTVPASAQVSDPSSRTAGSAAEAASLDAIAVEGTATFPLSEDPRPNA